ncbi:MAG: sugar phosphate isomerase/epimerase [Planctomycetota bacterium]|nr:sugar phosphate isomerase/epimerase [Planctomycetota bacterium]
MKANRRSFIQASAAIQAGAVLAASGMTSHQIQAAEKKFEWQQGHSPWPMCLDTTTLAKELPLEKKIEFIAASDFDAMEPWDRELTAYEEAGGSLKDLGKSIRDKGLFVPSVIGLWGSLGNTKEDFESRLEEHHTRLRMIRDIGSEHVQIIPDLQKRETFTKDIGAWCYRRISEIALNEYGLKTGIIFLNAVPQLKTLSDAVDVGMMSGWPDAKVIPDTYHNYHGGTEPNALRMLNPDSIAIFQFADSPAGLERQDTWCDPQRVLPGDGILPLVEQLKILYEIGYKGCVSLELYNPMYRKREPQEFLKEAHIKTLTVIKQALNSA